MQIFKKSKQDEVKFNEFISRVEAINDRLKVYSTEDMDFSSIDKIKKNFISKTDDFFREDRKLNIAIIGQVKAGKSSFLNTLLFKGEEVLPKAVTPKTATLTKIEYSDKNSICVEFYTSEEWKELENQANSTLTINQVIVAKEIMAMIKNRNVDVNQYLDNDNYVKEFSSYDELVKELNEYVGENGTYTPLVKSVTLKVNNENLKEISVVDTPGLNDPIASRTDKTKQFIERCDVVFFLSRASRFLDKSDVDLLCAQLPQKGVKKLVLICSKYDSGLLGTIYDKDDLTSAEVDTKHRLKKVANNTFNKIISEYEARGYNGNIIEVIKSCKTPIFVSSMAHNMSCKEIDEYNNEEMNVYEGLNIYDEINKEVLKDIGNIKEVQSIFDEVIENKEETLKSKAKDFIPTANAEVISELNNLKMIIEKRVNTLTNSDKDILEGEKKKISSQINGISASIEEVFGQIYVKLEQNKAEALKQLRDDAREYSQLSEKTGTETKTKSYSVSTSKWYRPSTWGSSRTQYYTYEERYYYLDVSDAIENIRNFANESCSSIEEAFTRALDIPQAKRRLLNMVIEHFDASDDSYDPMYFKLLVEKTLNTMDIPVIKIDVSKYLSEITSKFSGEIRNSSDKSNFKQAVFNSMSNLFDAISNAFVEELINYKSKLDNIKDSFGDTLLENINNEFQIIIKQFEDKEDEIKKGNEIINALSEEIKKLK